MKITVYGSGCKNCLTLAENAKVAAQELGVEVEVEKVEDMGKIVSAGIMTTPGLAIDGEVKFKGRVATKDEIKELLK